MRHPDGMQKLARAAFIATTALVVITAAFWGVRLYAAHRTQTIATPPPLNSAIGGFPLKGTPAPDFNLVNQFGQHVTLSSLHGHEVVLAFIDARCTTLCPLTAEILYNAKTHLGTAAANQVTLVAINANPTATSLQEVQSWSIQHGMLHQWLFLTGTSEQLQALYRQYQVFDQFTTDNKLVHDPLMFIIDQQGKEQLYYETLNSNATTDLIDEEKGLEAGMRQWLPHP